MVAIGRNVNKLLLASIPANMESFNVVDCVQTEHTTLSVASLLFQFIEDSDLGLLLRFYAKLLIVPMELNLE